ncbi:hypothetical protein A0H81_05616 [Grifola frondosa]|uniref:Uncharacterized protein n=1 Tax=Grifola frondosa TaxID=5627 RepID=A0A1C7MCL1_GRIFR|nr:hypothetical protein A0H81_05616 [Grifola frondosa]
MNAMSIADNYSHLPFQAHDAWRHWRRWSEVAGCDWSPLGLVLDCSGRYQNWETFTGLKRPQAYGGLGRTCQKFKITSALCYHGLPRASTSSLHRRTVHAVALVRDAICAIWPTLISSPVVFADFCFPITFQLL